MLITFHASQYFIQIKTFELVPGPKLTSLNVFVFILKIMNPLSPTRHKLCVFIFIQDMEPVEHQSLSTIISNVNTPPFHRPCYSLGMDTSLAIFERIFNKIYRAF